jgi:hypothetical protein
MASYVRTKYTEKAIQMYAKKNSLSEPWCSASERLFLLYYGDDVKVIEAQLKKGGKNA